MLTKDLVRFRILKGKVKPAFLDAAQEQNLHVAQQLIDIFQQSVGLRRSELEEMLEHVVEAFPGDAIIARGLIKLLLDRTAFKTPLDDEQPLFRAKLFEASAAALANEVFPCAEDYFKVLEQAMGQNVQHLRDAMYADLPAHHPIETFKAIMPDKLLHRYNTSMVQWLLLHADQLEIQLQETSPKQLRQILKYLRFNQLFAQIEKVGKQCFSLKVDGPMGLFGASRKYGLQLGRFFPALLQQKKWSLRTEVKPKNKTVVLELDQSCPLRPSHAHFTAYVPDDVLVFSRKFSEKIEGWSLDDSPDIIPLPGETYCFPDFVLTHESGKSVALELFHPWHIAHFDARLQQLAACEKVPLILGLAHKLTRAQGRAELIAASPYFSKWGFTFNDIPTVRALQPLLERFLADSSP